jgi:hypothetical protein
MSILLIRGYSQSGKDFVGRYLCKYYGYQRFAFADSLKRSVSKKYNVTVEQLHSQRGKLEICQQDPQQRTYRQILIDEALEARTNDPDCFAKDCCEEIKRYRPNNIVITDWRYPNELEILTQSFPEYVITPIHLFRPSQDDSPVLDISEYQLKDRDGDTILLNHMDDSIYDNIDMMMSTIPYIKNEVSW